MYKSLIFILMVVFLSSCSYFHIRRPIIEQGNIIKAEDVSKLHKGMSPTQVADIMGAPVLMNILTPNRLEYVYTYQNGYNPRTVKHVNCVFSGGRLVEVLQS